MSVVGTSVTVMGSSDASQIGRRGVIVLETARTLQVSTKEGVITIQKAGTSLTVEGGEEPMTGDDLAGRLEDRLRGRGR